MSVPDPRLLIIETSGRVGQVALAEGPMLKGVRTLDESRRHARDLAPAVVELLQEAGWQSWDVHAIVVSRGPGSYTGLRVGLMSAKAFAFATGAALIAVDTFAAIALQASPEAPAVDILADAQQDKVYVQRWVRSPAMRLPAPADALVIRPLLQWLAQREASAWVSGPGLRGNEGRLPMGTSIVDCAQWDPRPESLLRLGLARLEAGERDDVFALEPLYLRPSSAEEKWQEHSGTASR